MSKVKKPYADYTAEDIAKYRHAFIKNTLRRASYRWPWRNIAEQKATPARGKRRCAACKKEFPRADRKLDHINPVVDPLVGFTGWDAYAERLLTTLEGWQVLCKVCHDMKTEAERQIRKQTKSQMRKNK